MGGLMKTIIKRITAAAASAVIAVCSAGFSNSFGADTEEAPLFKVHFELGDDVTIVPDDDGNVPEIKDVEKEYNAAVFMPRAELEREGYYFTGWTADNVYGYKGGMVYRVPDHDVTITPVWNKKGDKDVHTVKYSVEIDGEVNEEYEKLVPPDKGISGSFIEISMYSFPRDGYKQYGWTDGTHLFKGQEYIIIQDEDITLTPNWYKKYLLTYTVGDADRVNGATKQEYEVIETGEVNLQNSSRFSRNGFEIIGWHCETDGKDYKCDQKFVMPSSDVIMTPIWFAINYNVVFFANTKSDDDDIRIKGKTDTTITIPECTAVNEGYTFGGWEKDDKIYQPGDEYLIVGEKPGLGVFFNAVWTPAGSETTTTTTSATTTVTTTTATSTSSVTSTSTTTAPTTTISSDIKPYSYVVVVRDKKTNELVNDVVLNASWYVAYEINGQDVSTGPLELIDASKGNPAVISYEKYKDAKKCSFSIDGVHGDSPYTFSNEDCVIESDDEKHIVYYNVYLTKTDIAYGDANCDGSVDMSDVVLIMQALANPDKYDVDGTSENCLTKAGRLNADVNQESPGLTTDDALVIQMYLLGLVDKLPLI
jgi:hypothetical protein